MKYITVLIALLFPLTTLGLEVSGVGFPDSGIWYSNENAEEGETVRIYTLLRNSSEYDIDGTLTFYVDDAPVGTSPFSLEQGQVSHFSTNWTTTKGEHAVHAAITESFTTLSNGNREAVTLPNQTIAKDTQKIRSKVILPAKTTDTTPLSIDATEQKTETKKEDTSGLLSAVAEYTPDSVEHIVEDTHEKTESFREGQLNNAIDRDVALDTIFSDKSPIDVLSEAWDEKDVITPFKYVWMFINKLLILILTYPIVFYIIGFYLLYRIIRWIKRRFFTRHEYY